MDEQQWGQFVIQRATGHLYTGVSGAFEETWTLEPERAARYSPPEAEDVVRRLCGLHPGRLLRIVNLAAVEASDAEHRLEVD